MNRKEICTDGINYLKHIYCSEDCKLSNVVFFSFDDFENTHEGSIPSNVDTTGYTLVYLVFTQYGEKYDPYWKYSFSPFILFLDQEGNLSETIKIDNWTVNLRFIIRMDRPHTVRLGNVVYSKENMSIDIDMCYRTSDKIEKQIRDALKSLKYISLCRTQYELELTKYALEQSWTIENLNFKVIQEEKEKKEKKEKERIIQAYKYLLDKIENML